MTGRVLPGGVDEIRSTIAETLHRHLGPRAREVELLDPECGRELAHRIVSFSLGGKRIRSILLWWGWRAGGGADQGPEARAAWSAGAAIEVLQTFALVHDDVMDAAPTRRGAPSVHAAHADHHRSRLYSGEPARYGDSMAVLTGDLALAWADDLLYGALTDLDTRNRAHRVWRDMRTEVMVGQFMDLRSQARTERSVRAALRTDRLKTASYTVERPLQLGAVMADAPDHVEEALVAYGRDVGVAYQLRDDLLDLYGDPDRTGREPGEDLREGKNTVLLALGIELARESGDSAALALLEKVGAAPVDAADAAEALARVGARDLVRGDCHALADRGAARVAALDIDPDVREGLLDFAATAART
ncbi:polyprenyl synthetase family protein [Nocardiopsis sp. MG754419]|uniref:polyprenyl synthetase family protein n=1 Tax=Nocardiopsis sp. MG754419 TaxID=2259865 RepID=UPI001BAC3286|nr:polyprenyl synthetase family protein [Nocardiopsis sp. MG754419]MBR8744633.1 polyprenyl synthetase family protein [Nocardiopsis sp. MG754419]